MNTFWNWQYFMTFFFCELRVIFFYFDMYLGACISPLVLCKCCLNPTTPHSSAIPFQAAPRGRLYYVHTFICVLWHVHEESSSSTDEFGQRSFFPTMKFGIVVAPLLKRRHHSIPAFQCGCLLHGYLLFAGFLLQLLLKVGDCIGRYVSFCQ